MQLHIYFAQDEAESEGSGGRRMPPRMMHMKDSFHINMFFLTLICQNSPLHFTQRNESNISSRNNINAASCYQISHSHKISLSSHTEK